MLRKDRRLIIAANLATKATNYGISRKALISHSCWPVAKAPLGRQKPELPLPSMNVTTAN